MPQMITKLTQKIEYLATKTNIIYRIAAQYYYKVVRNEINLAKITQQDHILCIGGGFCPFSAILLHQETGARVTVIDNNRDCIPKAREVVEKMGLSEHINLFCKDGCCPELSFFEYSVVHFALQVTPIECVFNEVKEKVLPGTKILVRRPKGCLKKMYCKFSNSFVNCNQSIFHNGACNIGSTLLYLAERKNEKENMVYCPNITPTHCSVAV